jgi:hypothetical protein
VEALDLFSYLLASLRDLLTMETAWPKLEGIEGPAKMAHFLFDQCSWATCLLSSWWCEARFIAEKTLISKEDEIGGICRIQEGAEMVENGIQSLIANFPVLAVCFCSGF